MIPMIYFISGLLIGLAIGATLTAIVLGGPWS